MSETTADLGAALGTLLRSYSGMVGPKLDGFPHGARGYQTLCEVVAGNPPSQAALAAKLGIDRTMMTYLIDDLTDAGLVERQPDPYDRRRRQIVATPGGRAAIASLCGQVAEAEEAALANLDDRERVIFRRLLTKAAGNGPLHTAEACAIVTEALDA
ncbi:MarR family winged helix-turn-helix transcriptional regulator [Actinoplanes sp. TRM 88003]|uniref:MarR family winged helix-turn-helix transcriptional regulator n=1 Tax=Paractinoplanes aksuensis TaxID=2939490 RepID=A0ABT1DW37_9ACTN|nr:MarR family winged helix-turn-helix transcriptional regulator [Actinoplanes aksuensis]MCO8274180.1 MarR family winged helix-turn-helix transcriptional regulator [Actinoplanes aksuensis]